MVTCPDYTHLYYYYYLLLLLLLCHNSASDNEEIERAIRNLFIRKKANIRRFRNCSILLKYCCSSHFVFDFIWIISVEVI